MKKLSSAVLFAALCLGLASCVKEDRMECPCYLIVDMSKVDKTKFEVVELDVLSADGFLHSADLNMEECDSALVIEVPRTDVTVCASWGADGSFDPAEGFVVEPGSSFPELWMHSSSINTRRDTARDTVRLYKSYCHMLIHLLSDGSPCPFSIKVDSPVCGYSAAGGLVEGSFLVNMDPDAAGDCELCVPRQKDDSMGLSILDTGDVIRRFALGHYIEESGFDWESPDLDDLEMTVDFSRTTVRLSISTWEQSYTFEVEI